MNFITNKNATIYNGNRKARGTVSEGTILDCNDWVWDSDKILVGMRAIISGEWSGKYVLDTDLDVYTEPEPEPIPTANLTYVIEIYDNGGLKVFDDTGFMIWQSPIA